MKKRILSCVLAICMTFSLIPASALPALAADDEAPAPAVTDAAGAPAEEDPLGAEAPPEGDPDPAAPVEDLPEDAALLAADIDVNAQLTYLGDSVFGVFKPSSTGPKYFDVDQASKLKEGSEDLAAGKNGPAELDKNYYYSVGGYGNVTEVDIDGVKYGANDTFTLSVDQNVFIRDKAWKVADDGQLRVATVLLTMCQGTIMVGTDTKTFTVDPRLNTKALGYSATIQGEEEGCDATLDDKGTGPATRSAAESTSIPLEVGVLGGNVAGHFYVFFEADKTAGIEDGFYLYKGGDTHYGFSPIDSETIGDGTAYGCGAYIIPYATDTTNAYMNKQLDGSSDTSHFYLFKKETKTVADSGDSASLTGTTETATGVGMITVKAHFTTNMVAQIGEGETDKSTGKCFSSLEDAINSTENATPGTTEIKLLKAYEQDEGETGIKKDAKIDCGGKLITGKNGTNAKFTVTAAADDDNEKEQALLAADELPTLEFVGLPTGYKAVVTEADGTATYEIAKAADVTVTTLGNKNPSHPVVAKTEVKLVEDKASDAATVELTKDENDGSKWTGVIKADQPYKVQVEDVSAEPSPSGPVDTGAILTAAGSSADVTLNQIKLTATVTSTTAGKKGSATFKKDGKAVDADATAAGWTASGADVTWDGKEHTLSVTASEEDVVSQGSLFAASVTTFEWKYADGTTVITEADKGVTVDKATVTFDLTKMDASTAKDIDLKCEIRTASTDTLGAGTIYGAKLSDSDADDGNGGVPSVAQLKVNAKVGETTTEGGVDVIPVELSLEGDKPLPKHTNRDLNPAYGWWVGFAVSAPEGAEEARYTFGDTPAEVAEDKLPAAVALDKQVAGENEGVAFYVNVGNHKVCYVGLQWQSKDGSAKSPAYIYKMDMNAVKLGVGVKVPTMNDPAAAGTIKVLVDGKEMKANQVEYLAEGYHTVAVSTQNEGYTINGGKYNNTDLSKSSNGTYGFTVEKADEKIKSDASGPELVPTVGKTGYTVTCYPGNGGEVQTYKMSHGDSASTIPDPKWSGYKFAGWYTDENYTGVFDTKTETVTSNITLYAKWNSVVTFTVSGDVDGAKTAASVTGAVEQYASTTLLNGEQKAEKEFQKSDKDLKFKVSANNGYSVDSVMVGGVKQDPDANGIYSVKVDRSRSVAITLKQDAVTVSVSPAALTVQETSEATFEVTTNSGAVPLKDGKLVVKSADDKIATVSGPVAANGVSKYTVRGVKAGTTQITITAIAAGNETNKKEETCNVTVVARGVTTVNLDKSSVELSRNKVDGAKTQDTITASVVGSTENVTWTSSDPSLVSVEPATAAKDTPVTVKLADETSEALGKVTITAAVGDVQATCTVEVTWSDKDDVAAKADTVPDTRIYPQAAVIDEASGKVSLTKLQNMIMNDVGQSSGITVQVTAKVVTEPAAAANKDDAGTPGSATYTVVLSKNGVLDSVTGTATITPIPWDTNKDLVTAAKNAIEAAAYTLSSSEAGNEADTAKELEARIAEALAKAGISGVEVSGIEVADFTAANTETEADGAFSFTCQLKAGDATGSASKPNNVIKPLVTTTKIEEGVSTSGGTTTVDSQIADDALILPESKTETDPTDKTDAVKVTIDATTDGNVPGATKTSVAIPKDTVEKLADSTITTETTINTDLADVKLPVETMDEIKTAAEGTVDAGGSVTSIAMKVEDKSKDLGGTAVDGTPVAAAVDVSLVAKVTKADGSSEEKEIPAGTQERLVTIKTTKDAIGGTALTDLVVLHLPENGGKARRMTVVSAAFGSDGFTVSVTFRTTHFSTFVLLGNDQAKDIPTEASGLLLEQSPIGESSYINVSVKHPKTNTTYVSMVTMGGDNNTAVWTESRTNSQDPYASFAVQSGWTIEVFEVADQHLKMNARDGNDNDVTGHAELVTEAGG